MKNERQRRADARVSKLKAKLSDLHQELEIAEARKETLEAKNNARREANLKAQLAEAMEQVNRARENLEQARVAAETAETTAMESRQELKSLQANNALISKIETAASRQKKDRYAYANAQDAEDLADIQLREANARVSEVQTRLLCVAEDSEMAKPADVTDTQTVVKGSEQQSRVSPPPRQPTPPPAAVNNSASPPPSSAVNNEKIDGTLGAL